MKVFACIAMIATGIGIVIFGCYLVLYGLHLPCNSRGEPHYSVYLGALFILGGGMGVILSSLFSLIAFEPTDETTDEPMICKPEADDDQEL